MDTLCTYVYHWTVPAIPTSTKPHLQLVDACPLISHYNDKESVSQFEMLVLTLLSWFMAIHIIVCFLIHKLITEQNSQREIELFCKTSHGAKQRVGSGIHFRKLTGNTEKMLPHFSIRSNVAYLFTLLNIFNLTIKGFSLITVSTVPNVCVFACLCVRVCICVFVSLYVCLCF